MAAMTTRILPNTCLLPIQPTDFRNSGWHHLRAQSSSVPPDRDVGAIGNLRPPSQTRNMSVQVEERRGAPHISADAVQEILAQFTAKIQPLVVGVQQIEVDFEPLYGCVQRIEAIVKEISVTKPQQVTLPNFFLPPPSNETTGNHLSAIPSSVSTEEDEQEETIKQILQFRERVGLQDADFFIGEGLPDKHSPNHRDFGASEVDVDALPSMSGMEDTKESFEHVRNGSLGCCFDDAKELKDTEDTHQIIKRQISPLAEQIISKKISPLAEQLIKRQSTHSKNRLSQFTVAATSEASEASSYRVHYPSVSAAGNRFGKSEPGACANSACQPENNHDSLVTVEGPSVENSPTRLSSVGTQRPTLLKQHSDGKNSWAEFVQSIMFKHHFAAGEASAGNLLLLFLHRLLDTAVWWDRMEEPQRKGCLARFSLSAWFEALSLLVIITNCVLLGYAADWYMKNPGKDLKYLTPVEYGFMLFYILELVLKLVVHRLFFFINPEWKWNLLDFVLVMVSSMDILLTEILHSGAHSSSDNVIVMRILRIMKLLKILRAFRAMRFVKEMMVLLDSLRQSLLSLFWVFVMLMFMLCIFALVILQGMAEYIADESKALTSDQEERIRAHFGSIAKTVLTLYMSVTGGDDWGTYYRMVEETGTFYAGMFLFFTFFFTFALFNMLTGIFVEKTVTASTPNRAELALQERRKARRDAAEFKHVCRILDEDGNGVITWQDFQKYMHDETMVAYMASIGLEIHDIECFFNMVAGSAKEGKVAIDRFVNTCMVLKGYATAIDMQQQLFEMHALTQHLSSFEKTCTKRFHQIELKLSKLGETTL